MGNYICEICSDFISENEIAHSEPRSVWEGDLIHICDMCYAYSVDDGYDAYVLESAGWGTDEDYGFYGD